MMKKILVTSGIALLLGLTLLSAGCSKSGVQPTQIFQTSTQPFQSTPQSAPAAQTVVASPNSTTNAADSNTAPAVIQSGLPLTVSQPADSGLNALDVTDTDNCGIQAEVILMVNVN
jgi:hypothetical protein